METGTWTGETRETGEALGTLETHPVSLVYPVSLVSLFPVSLFLLLSAPTVC